MPLPAVRPARRWAVGLAAPASGCVKEPPGICRPGRGVHSVSVVLQHQADKGIVDFAATSYRCLVSALCVVCQGKHGSMESPTGVAEKGAEDQSGRGLHRESEREREAAVNLCAGGGSALESHSICSSDIQNGGFSCGVVNHLVVIAADLA